MIVNLFMVHDGYLLRAHKVKYVFGLKQYRDAVRPYYNADIHDSSKTACHDCTVYVYNTHTHSHAKDRFIIKSI